MCRFRALWGPDGDKFKTTNRHTGGSRARAQRTTTRLTFCLAPERSELGSAESWHRTSSPSSLTVSASTARRNYRSYETWKIELRPFAEIPRQLRWQAGSAAGIVGLFEHRTGCLGDEVGGSGDGG